MLHIDKEQVICHIVIFLICKKRWWKVLNLKTTMKFPRKMWKMERQYYWKLTKWNIIWKETTCSVNDLHNSILFLSQLSSGEITLPKTLSIIDSWRIHWMWVVTATSKVQFLLSSFLFLLIVPTFCKWMSFSRELFRSSSHPKAALKDSSVAANSYVCVVHTQ